MNHSEIVSFLWGFLWGVADLVRDTFKRGKYQDAVAQRAIVAAVTGKVDVCGELA